VYSESGILTGIIILYSYIGHCHRRRLCSVLFILPPPFLLSVRLRILGLHIHKLNLIVLPVFTLNLRIYRLCDPRTLHASRPSSRAPDGRHAVRQLVWGVVLLVLRIVLRRAKAVWRDICQEASQSWHADAEDADESFEDRPVCSRDIVVCWIRRGGELY
jgi:hypothetical protein